MKFFTHLATDGEEGGADGVFEIANTPYQQGNR